MILCQTPKSLISAKETMNIAEIIKQNNFNEDEKSIIFELSKQIEKGNNSITVRELAKITFCSPSKIVRFAKKLGFYGYSDMLFSFRKHHEEIVEFKFNNSWESIFLTKESLKVVDKLIKDLVSNKYTGIYLQGLGYSQYVCDFFRDKLIEVGLSSFCINPLDVSNKRGKYILILVSNSGETMDIVKIAKECQNDKCVIYAMSSQEKSKLCKLVENNIIIKQKKELNIKKTGSYFIGNSIILIEKIFELVNDFENIGG